MFFRNRNKLSKAKTAERAPDVVRGIGSGAVEQIAAPQEIQKTYAEEVRDRITRLRDAERGLVKEALQKGIPQEHLPSLLADAMNAGEHPKILQGMAFRGSGVSLMLLEGHIPAEALDTHITRDGEGNVTSSIITLSGEARSLKGDTFTYADTGVLPQSSLAGDPIDVEMLAKIDAHFPLAAQQPAQ